MRFFGGLDLGQVQDPTALAILEQTIDPKGVTRYTCGYLRRFELGTSYPEIVDELDRLLRAKKYAGDPGPLLYGLPLAVDQTGVGLAVVDFLRRAQLPAQLKPILITAGHGVTFEDGSWHVPKKELVSVLQVLLQGGRLKVANSLPEAGTLVEELNRFSVKITAAGNETFESWRERDHDDLVLAVAMAAWIGEQAAKLGDVGEPMILERRRPAWMDYERLF
jgi:hypothetical protein